jgi:hypothetical protein
MIKPEVACPDLHGKAVSVADTLMFKETSSKKEVGLKFDGYH